MLKKLLLSISLITVLMPCMAIRRPDSYNLYGGEISLQESRNYLLLSAISSNNLRVIRKAIKEGAELNKTIFGQTFLSIAVDTGSTEAVGILLDAGARINQRDVNGDTPLIRAAKKGNGDMARYLLNQFADKSKKNYKGFSAADIAQRNGRIDLVELLDSAEKHIDLRSSMRCSSEIPRIEDSADEVGWLCD